MHLRLLGFGYAGCWSTWGQIVDHGTIIATSADVWNCFILSLHDLLYILRALSQLSVWCYFHSGQSKFLSTVARLAMSEQTSAGTVSSFKASVPKPQVELDNRCSICQVDGLCHLPSVFEVSSSLR